MKSYQNPQPQAVEKADKKQNKPSLKSEKLRKSGKQALKKSNKEIFKTESEEQAWRDALKKDKKN